MTFRAPHLAPEGDARKYLSDEQFEYAQGYLARTQRMLFLRGPIMGMPHRSDSSCPTMVGDDIIAFNAEDSEAPIYLVIESPGGDVSAGMILYDHIRMSKAPITTIGHNVASLAVNILAAGKVRVILPHARAMIHLPAGSISGDVEEIEVRTRLLQQIKEEMVDTYIECGAHAGLKDKKGTTKAKIKKQIMKDLEQPEMWMTAQEVVDYGLADRIATPNDIFL